MSLYIISNWLHFKKGNYNLFFLLSDNDYEVTEKGSLVVNHAWTGSQGRQGGDVMHSDELEWGFWRPLVKDDESSPLLALQCGQGGGSALLGCSAGALGTDTVARLLISHWGECVAASWAATPLPHSVTSLVTKLLVSILMPSFSIGFYQGHKQR